MTDPKIILQDMDAETAAHVTDILDDASIKTEIVEHRPPEVSSDD